MAKRRVYLDWNATTPPLDAVIDAMRDAAKDSWGNPASIHGEGRQARKHVENARAAVAKLADADPRDVILTSGGTEANNLAMRSFIAPLASGEGPNGPTAADLPVIITSALEHPSVLQVAEALAREGRARVRLVLVQPDGMLDADDLATALAEPNAALVALQVVNHETGALHALDAALAAAGTKGLHVHLDAVQAWGKVRMSGQPNATRSLAAHKIRGPKGVGALIHPPGARVLPVLRGGAQERGIRPGTVDPIACAGLAVAAEHALRAPEARARIAALRNDLVAGLRAVAGSLGIAFDVIEPKVAAGHVANVAFGGIDGPELVAALDLEGVAIASGSACSAGTHEPSAGIAAIPGPGGGLARAKRSIRLSLGETTTEDDVTFAVAAFDRVVRRTTS